MSGLALLLALAALFMAFGARRRLAEQQTRLEAMERELRALWAGQGEAPPPAEMPASAGAAQAALPQPALPEATTAATAARPPLAARAPAEPGREAAAASSAIPKVRTRPGAQPAAPAGPSRAAQLLDWLRGNWVYPLAALALMLSGLYLVQYAAEHGVLGPRARTGLGLAGALALMLGGEWLRRRPAAGRALPATLAGAGIVVAMTVLLAALRLYALISPTTAFLLLAALAFAAVLLGWLHGPILTILGVVAGSLVPFSLGGGGHPPEAVLGHFVLLAVVGLAVAAPHRWHWAHWIALPVPIVAILLWAVAGTGANAAASALLLVAAAGLTLPFGFGAPAVEGKGLLGNLWKSDKTEPAPGVAASFLASTLAIGGIAAMATGLAGPLLLLGFALLPAVWARRATALADQAVLAVLGFPLWVVVAESRVLMRHSLSGDGLPQIETLGGAPLVTVVLTAALAALAFLWRSEASRGRAATGWFVAALALPAATLLALHVSGAALRALSEFGWSLVLLAHAGAAVLLALRQGQARGAGEGGEAARDSNLRLGIASCLALAIIALALTVNFGESALTLAFGVLLVAAALLDRRFDIPLLGLFQVAGVAALLWRLTMVPGDFWLVHRAAGWEFALSLAVSLGAPLAALALGAPAGGAGRRELTRGLIGTLLVAIAALSSSLLIRRYLPGHISVPATFGLQLISLAALLASQLSSRWLVGLDWLRKTVIGVLLLLIGALGLGVLTAWNPLFGGAGTRLIGGALLNELLLIYALPGLTLLGLLWLNRAAWRGPGAGSDAQAIGLAAGLGGGLMLFVWLFSAIRFFWQGGARFPLAYGFGQAELYTYTVALLLFGALLLGLALKFGSGLLRRLALGLIGVAAAKAFLVDASALTGLLRAGAFLGLGLSLAGLAWLNGWIAAREGAAPKPAQG